MVRNSLTKKFSRQSTQASLRRVLIIPFVLQIVAVIVLISWLSLENGELAVNNVAEQLRGAIVARVEQHLESYLSVPKLITEINLEAIEDGHLDFKDAEELIKHITKQFKIFDGVSSIKFASVEKEYIALERLDKNNYLYRSGVDNDYKLSVYRSDKEGKQRQLIQAPSIDFNLENYPWFKVVKLGGIASWSPIYNYVARSNLVIAYTAPIYEVASQSQGDILGQSQGDIPSQRQLKLLGVTGADLSLSHLGDYLKTLEVGKSGLTFIVDRTGLMVASSTKERPFLVIDGKISRLKATSSNIPLIQKSAAFLSSKFPDLAQLRKEEKLEFQINSQREFIEVEPLKSSFGLDWLIVVVIPESDFMNQIDANSQSIIYLGIGAFVLALITGWYTSQRILQPIQSLSKAADALSQGEWNQKVDMYSQGELGVLARAFNRMAIQLQESFLELRAKEEKASSIATLLKEAQKVANLGSWELDLITEKVTWSEEVFHIFGLKPNAKALSYRRFLIKVHPDDRQHVAELLTRHSIEHNSYQMEYRLLRPDGSFRYAFSKGFYKYDDDGNVMRAFGIIMDITDRKEVELSIQRSAIALQQQANELETTLIELKQAQAQLIQGEKMSALGQLVAGVAHEINNPVNFIYGNISPARNYADDLLTILRIYQQEYPQPRAEIQEQIDELDLDFIVLDLPKLLDSMQVGAVRIREIVKSLRSFSRLDESDMKSVDIHEGLDSTLMILQSRLKTNSNQPDIVIEKNYGSLPTVGCYAGQLNQVFMNILSNAIDALDAQETSWSGSESPKIEIRTFVEDGRSIQIRIRDNGTGIDPEVINRLFDPFFTTKPVGKGTGLGLAISHSIVVEKHKGKLYCNSEPGQGTEFVISIPIQQQNSSS